MPNLLGRALRYVLDGFDYATHPFKSFKSSRQPSAVIATTARYNTTRGNDGQLDHFAQLGITNPYMFAGASLIGKRISDVSLFKVQERQHGGKWVDVKDHAFIAVLGRPNSLMTGELFLSEVAFWNVFYGNCYWLFDSPQPGIGEIREIWPLPARMTRPRPELIRYSSASGELTIDYEYVPGAVFTLPGENVAHFRTANPFDYWVGLSALTALQFNLSVAYNQSKWLGDFYGENNAVPVAVISVPPELTNDDLNQIKEDIISQFGGQRRTAITRAGEMDVKVIQHTVADMQVLDAQDHYAKEVRTVLNIPEGLSSASSGQARLAAETALQRDAVQPLLNHIAAVLTVKAMPFYGRHEKYRVVAEDTVPQDKALAVTEYSTYGKDRTVNENRDVQKMPPLRFTGVLAYLQPLLDEVPSSSIPLIAPILAQAGAGMGQPPMGGAGGQQRNLIAEMIGQTLIDAMTGRASNDNVTVAQPAGLLPQGEIEEAGYRVAGQQTQSQLVDQLVGREHVVAMSGAEKSTLEHLLHGWTNNDG